MFEPFLLIYAANDDCWVLFRLGFHYVLCCGDKRNWLGFYIWYSIGIYNEICQLSAVSLDNLMDILHGCGGLGLDPHQPRAGVQQTHLGSRAVVGGREGWPGTGGRGAVCRIYSQTRQGYGQHSLLPVQPFTYIYMFFLRADRYINILEWSHPLTLR